MPGPTECGNKAEAGADTVRLERGWAGSVQMSGARILRAPAGLEAAASAYLWHCCVNFGLRQGLELLEQGLRNRRKQRSLRRHGGCRPLASAHGDERLLQSRRRPSRSPRPID